MNISNIPGLELANPTHTDFLRKATLQEVCDRFNNQYAPFKNSENKACKGVYDTTLAVLNHYQLLGEVYSYIDQTSSKQMFSLSKDIIEKNKDKEVTENNSEHKQIQKFKSDTNNVNIERLKKLSSATNKSRVLIERCIKKKLEYDLSIEEIMHLSSEKKCYYTGVAFEPCGDNSLTFDRISNKVGYVSGNVVACTQKVNELKSSLFESTHSLFKDISDLKQFVDVIYAKSCGNNTDCESEIEKDFDIDKYLNEITIKGLKQRG